MLESLPDQTPRPTQGVRARQATVRRRAKIRDVAVKVFAESGYAAASLREVAAAAGLQKGHLSYYFPNKEHLLYEIVFDMHEQFVRGLPQWLLEAKPSPDARLQHVLTQHAAIACRRHEQTKVAYENFRFLSPEHHEEIVSMRDGYEEELRQLIEDAQPAQALSRAPSSLLTKTVLGMTNWPYQWFQDTGGMSVDTVSTVLAELAMHSLQLTPLADPCRTGSAANRAVISPLTASAR